MCETKMSGKVKEEPNSEDASGCLNKEVDIKDNIKEEIIFKEEHIDGN